MVGHRQHGPRVSLRQLAALDEREDVLRQVEQPEPVRDTGLGPAHSLGHLRERQPELVEQRRVGTGLFDRREVLAGDVLDEREEERVSVLGLPHDSRNRW